MTSRALVLIYALLIALFSVWAWKLRRGQWLRSISGNAFATKEELELPYQKRMGRETSVLVAMCALLFAMLAYNEAFGMERTTLLIASAAFFVAIVAGSIAVAVRANRAAKEEQVDAGLREVGWPSKERNLELGGGKKLTKPANAGKLGGQEAFLLVIVLGQFLVYGALAAFVIFSH